MFLTGSNTVVFYGFICSKLFCLYNMYFFFLFFISLLCTWHFGWLEWAFHSHHTYKVCLSCGLWFGFVLWGELPNSQSTFKNLSCAMFTTDILMWTLLFLTSQFSLCNMLYGYLYGAALLFSKSSRGNPTSPPSQLETREPEVYLVSCSITIVHMTACWQSTIQRKGKGYTNRI